MSALHKIYETHWDSEFSVEDANDLRIVAETLGITIDILFPIMSNGINKSEILNEGCIIQIIIQQLSASDYAILCDRKIIQNEQIYIEIKENLNKFIKSKEIAKKYEKDAYKLVNTLKPA